MLASGADADCTLEELGRSRERERQL